MAKKPRTPDDILEGLQAKALAFLRFDEPTYNPEFVEKIIKAAQEPDIGPMTAGEAIAYTQKLAQPTKT